MKITTLFQQPSLRRLLFFCLGTGVVALGLLYFLWCPVQCWRVRRWLASNEIQAAAQFSQSLSREHNQCAECYFLHAKAARRLGDFRRASEALERASNLKWNPEDIARERVLAMVQTGRIAPLKADLKAIFATDLEPAETEEVYEALALGHLSAFDGPELLQCLDYWQEWNPKATRPRLMRAQFAERLIKHADAAKQYESIVQDHPGCREARLSWGRCLLELNQPTAAEVQLRQCFDEQRDAQTAILYAQSLIQTGQSAMAGTLLKEFQGTPEPAMRAEVLEALGRWYLNQNQAAEALANLQECVKLAPENATAWHSLAAAYSMSGSPEKAKESLAISQETQKRLQRMGAIVNELSLNPQSLPLRIEAAQILFQQGMDVDAVAWLNTVLSQDLHDRQANEILMKYYTQQGKPELAARHRELGGIPDSK